MAKAKTAKQPVKKKKQSVGETEVTVCRRTNDRRSTVKGAKAAKAGKSGKGAVPATDEEAAKKSSDNVLEAVPVQLPERRKVQRRRQIDPTTCERDYSQDEIEFMHALDAYKRSSGRMFPTCSEILEVVRGLGYAKKEWDDPAERVLETLRETAELASEIDA